MIGLLALVLRCHETLEKIVENCRQILSDSSHRLAYLKARSQVRPDASPDLRGGAHLRIGGEQKRCCPRIACIADRTRKVTEDLLESLAIKPRERCGKTLVTVFKL